MKNRNLLLYVISGILSAVLLAYLLLNLDWEILRVAFSDLHWGWLGMAFLAYLLNIFLRALRFTNLIYSRPVKWIELVPVSALHNILMYLMPAKTGDVAYIFLAKDRLDLSLTEGTATLLAARYYDFSVVALVLAILLPFSKKDMPVWIFESSVIFCLLILLGTIGILLFLRFSKPATDNQPVGEKTLITRIRAAWTKFIAGLREIQNHGAHGRVALLTAGIWLCVYSNFYFATRSMGLPVAFYHIAIISIVMIPLTLLPLQGFANIGTHEVGWTSVLVAFGYPYKTALAIAAGSHLVLLFSVLISGGVAFFGAQIISKSIKHEGN
ncbi:MAG TPA: lysylphosphatidylglycerol synthase transmembrane domain-containing protein [Anaerolineales bacterium]|nr:lysylphosphatidylglycerol synthase transmembrane domain-containing protein [Anaerolineales bacterium]HMX18813.1 lysylphosphatidylglycerol synthase transmembrane domain-containing protein [Anaerolineales bacterium]HMX73832.1 lysylphosphatidylglycerol synthase transmembrane domain-containing protein [Anaerolineales bacterium]HMZ44376.1 lysylphosphatidylglycerol synthase transmembrane domain-containing protein [Anaerolineales bacterium]HNC88670.1 lysylphosphatidylglycerol synthase transmembrane